MAEQKFGITIKKAENFSEWYQQVVLRSELLDYYDIRGCFIMRPTSMYIWEEIRKFFDREIKQLGVQECYFPMLVTKKNLEMEKDHLSNFNPELAWITNCGDKELEEPVAMRPTSETIMYPSYARWLKTYRDLPLKLNQWCSVLRWDVKSTLPFIRGREFLWQEGHTVFYKKEEAEEEVGKILDIYTRVYKDLLAVPVTAGVMSKNETFGGADYTLSIEAFIPGTGKGVQAATSHHLGQNFARIFDVKVETESSADEKQFVYQNSWGLTTRSIGVATMIHSDNRGFVCPPRVAQIQIVVMMCGIKASTTAEEEKELRKYAANVVDTLKIDFRVHFDDRDNVSPGYKFNHWELRGVPLRVEIGFKDMANGAVMIVRRDTLGKTQVILDNLSGAVGNILNKMHDEMYNRAVSEKERRTRYADTMDDLKTALNELCQANIPWCGTPVCEDQITDITTIIEGGVVIAHGAKSLCIPFGNVCEGKVCLNCGDNAKHTALFGRSY